MFAGGIRLRKVQSVRMLRLERPIMPREANPSKLMPAAGIL